MEKDENKVEVENKEKKEGNELVEWIKSLLTAVAIAIVIKLFIIDSTQIDGLSMFPTLEHKDRLLVSKISTFFREPRRCEIVVFHAPDTNKDYIKRVIGLPGDVVEIIDGDVYVNGKKIEEDYIENGVETTTGDIYKWEVPAGSYFVLGDNRKPGQSKDSRLFGTIDEKSIVSYAFLRYFPFNKIGLMD